MSEKASRTESEDNYSERPKYNESSNNLPRRRSHSPRPVRNRYRPKTFVGRVFDDFHSMPWDKVVAALISGLLIYIGAARLHYFTDEISDLKVAMQQQRVEFFEMQKKDAYRIELEMAGLELRIMKNLKSEIKNVVSRLEDVLLDMHQLDKRLNTHEVLSQIQRSNHQHMALPYSSTGEEQRRPNTGSSLPFAAADEMQGQLKTMLKNLLSAELSASQKQQEVQRRRQPSTPPKDTSERSAPSKGDAPSNHEVNKPPLDHVHQPENTREANPAGEATPQPETVVIG